MPGGLIQLASAGIQDAYLTKNPEITFFKKVYKKHTHFSLELKEIKYDQGFEYGKTTEFNIPNNGDLLHRCYLQVEVPNIKYSDSIITDTNYISYKTLRMEKIKTKSDTWSTKYTNLFNFSEIEISLYQYILELLKSENMSVIFLQKKILVFISLKNRLRADYKILVDDLIIDSIDILGYIKGLNQTVTMATIKTDVDKKYNTIVDKLNFYHSNWKYYSTIYDNYSNNNLKHAWIKYLGHYYVEDYELEIGGEVVENYTSDTLHCYQEHNVNKNKKNNYYKMIGHTTDIYTYSNTELKKQYIYIPLIYWFCKSYAHSLPIVAMQYSTIKFRFKLNKIKNLIYFRDRETDYDKFLIFDIPKENYDQNNYEGIVLDDMRDMSKFSELNIEKVDILYPELIYRYTFKTITKKLLELKFSEYGDTGSTPEYIITTYGDSTNKTVSLLQWITLLNNLTTDTNLESARYILSEYNSYLDYNYILNLIPKPNIKLLVEYGYIDDVERDMFANSQLEYIVDILQENTFSIHNTPVFDGDLSFNKPIKDLMWFIRPKQIMYGLYDYSKIYPYLFKNLVWYTNETVDNIEILLDNYNLLKEKSLELYYNNVTSYQFLNDTLPDGVYYLSCSLHPEVNQPSGSINMSRFSSKVVKVYLNDAFRTEYFTTNSNQVEFKIITRSYNVLVVKKGQAKLIFY